MTYRRLIIEQIDPLRPKPGGIDTCVRGLLKYAPPDIEPWLAGIDATGNYAPGTWQEVVVEGRSINFFPLARLDNADLSRVIPHSARMTAGLLRHRGRVAGPGFEVVQTHRINMGFVATQLFRTARHVQFLHSSGTANLGRESKSLFRFARTLYGALEQYVIPRSDAAVVFSRDGAERLSNLGRVHFSPTWFDEEKFYPGSGGRSSSGTVKLAWACRMEPAKRPDQALRAVQACPHTVLTMAGSGTMRPEVEGLVRSLGLADRVALPGYVEKAAMGEFLREHDALFMSSAFEGYSRAIVEALACGLPVITTPGGDPNGLIIDGYNGFRLAADCSGLCEAIERLPSIRPADCVESVRDHSASEIVVRVLSLGTAP